MKHCFPCYLFLALLLILAAHIAAEITSAYYLFLWLDIPMHFAGGAWLASAGYYFFFVRDTKLKLKPALPVLIGLLFLVGLSMIVGVLWEFFEYAADIYAEKYLGGRAIHQPGLTDTLGDLFFDMAGATVAALCFLILPKSYREPK